MILKKILLDYYNRRRNETFSAPFGLDDPKQSIRSAEEWHAYPINDFTYSFNSWAFRGPDYEQYLGQPVNICLGDSFTLNIGGPVEHSWSSQLAKNFDIPTLNFGIDGAGNDTIRMVYEYLLTVFDVQNTFVMYSFFHRRYNSSNKSLDQAVYSDKENFDFFEKNKIDQAYYTFIPPWCWGISEGDYINCNYKNYYSLYNCEYDLDFVYNNRHLFISQKKYNNFRGKDWPSYKNFIAGTALSDEIYKEIFVTKFNDLKLATISAKNGQDLLNRDGFHLNYYGNKLVCDYFLSQVNRTPIV